MKFDNIKVTKNLHLSETIEQALLMLDDYLDGKSIATVYWEDGHVFVAHGFLSAPTRIDTEPHLQVMGIIQDLDSDEDYHRHVNRVSENLDREVCKGVEEESIARLTKWVRDCKVGTHSFFVTTNLVAWMIILFGAFTGRLAWAEDFYDVDPNVVGEIIINSELVICKSNVCSYYDQPSRLLKHDQTFPDGYIVVYPEDKAKPEERIAAREHVVEYWTQYMRTN